MFTIYINGNEINHGATIEEAAKVFELMGNMGYEVVVFSNSTNTRVNEMTLTAVNMKNR